MSTFAKWSFDLQPGDIVSWKLKYFMHYFRIVSPPYFNRDLNGGNGAIAVDLYAVDDAHGSEVTAPERQTWQTLPFLDAEWYLCRKNKLPPANPFAVQEYGGDNHWSHGLRLGDVVARPASAHHHPASFRVVEPPRQAVGWSNGVRAIVLCSNDGQKHTEILPLEGWSLKHRSTPEEREALRAVAPPWQPIETAPFAHTLGSYPATSPACAPRMHMTKDEVLVRMYAMAAQAWQRLNSTARSARLAAESAESSAEMVARILSQPGATIPELARLWGAMADDAVVWCASRVTYCADLAGDPRNQCIRQEVLKSKSRSELALARAKEAVDAHNPYRPVQPTD